MYGLSAATKRSGRCGEVAVSGGSTVTNNNLVAAIKIMFSVYLVYEWSFAGR